ncbi:hypothetical protein PS903_03632 [Pseudomonas fluorescens]|nr:hypothetical protein PS903_03632 [Pseudomonas fluorescens]
MSLVKQVDRVIVLRWQASSHRYRVDHNFREQPDTCGSGLARDGDPSGKDQRLRHIHIPQHPGIIHRHFNHPRLRKQRLGPMITR